MVLADETLDMVAVSLLTLENMDKVTLVMEK